MEDEKKVDLRRLVAEQLGVPMESRYGFSGGGRKKSMVLGYRGRGEASRGAADEACFPSEAPGGEEGAEVEGPVGVGVRRRKEGVKAGKVCLFEPRHLPMVFSRIKNAPVLLVTRRIPWEIREAAEHDDLRIIWITSVRAEGETCVEGKNLSRVGNLLDIFLREKGGIVMVDAFEYMAVQSGFTGALRWLHGIIDRVKIYGGVLYLFLDIGCFTREEGRLIKREVDILFDESSEGSGVSSLEGECYLGDI